MKRSTIEFILTILLISVVVWLYSMSETYAINTRAVVCDDEIIKSTTTGIIDDTTISVEPEPEPIVEECIGLNNVYDIAIYEATKDTVVDPYLAIAISRLETGHYTSRAFVNGHNFGGMTGSKGVMSFSSFSVGLDKYVNMLERYYNRGMDTADKMRSTYCPPNEKWADVVNDIYDELKSGLYN